MENLQGGFARLKNLTILCSIPGLENIKAAPFSRNRTASLIQHASDFESKIYAAAIVNKNFSDQICGKQ